MIAIQLDGRRRGRHKRLEMARATLRCGRAGWAKSNHMYALLAVGVYYGNQALGEYSAGALSPKPSQKKARR